MSDLDVPEDVDARAAEGLSIMGEVVAVPNGREGGRLSAAGAGRIREVGS